MAKKKTPKTRRRTPAKSSKASLPAAEASVAELTAELRKRQKGIHALERRRDRVTARLGEVNAQIAELNSLTDMTPTGRVRNTQTLPDALYSVMRGKRMSVTEAAEAVKASGYVSTAASLRAVVNQALHKDERFRKVERGVYIAK